MCVARYQANKAPSTIKKKSVRKAVNLSELQRYFKAAEEAAREIMLEEAINIQRMAETSNQVYVAGASDTEGVIQLTTLSSLPLKSPKRLIALQLANNNPAFRERFRQKLEASGGPIAARPSGDPLAVAAAAVAGVTGGVVGGASSSSGISGASSAVPPPGWASGHPGSNISTNEVLALNEIERYLNSPGNGHQSDSSATPVKPARGKRKMSAKKDSSSKSEISLDDFVAQGAPDDSGVKEKKPRKPRKSKKDLDDSTAMDLDALLMGESTITPAPKKRGRKKKVSIDDEQGDDNSVDLSSGRDRQGSQSGGDGSIIKRRRKGELRVVVDGGLAFGAMKNNLHSLVGGGLTDMGPPGETPRRSARLKSGAPLSSLSNLNTLSNLDSPFGSASNADKPFPDMFSTFGIDTPGTRGLLTGLTNGPESVRFDFDDVAAHFPSPRAGEHVKGSSPFRWSTGSAGSMGSGFFNFADGMLSARSSTGGSSSGAVVPGTMLGNPLADPPTSSSAHLGHPSSQTPSGPNPPSSISKKHKKAHRRSDDGGQSDGGEATNSAEKPHHSHNGPFQSPTAVSSSRSQHVSELCL